MSRAARRIIGLPVTRVDVMARLRAGRATTTAPTPTPPREDLRAALTAGLRQAEFDHAILGR